MSKVAHVKTRGAVIDDTRKAMNLANWREHVQGNSVFLKVNYMSDQVIPGLCTSPWVLEGVLQEIQSEGIRIIVGDADLATNNQLDIASKNWGVLELCRKYNAKFVNLSRASVRTLRTDIPETVQSIQIPEIILNQESIVTLPVAKTHYLTRMTCSLKNQWGTIPTIRQQFHPIASLLIPEINRLLNMSFTVIDATICMEGEGPRTGIPKVVNSILASSDLVAADRCIQDMMGLKGNIEHISRASKIIKGSSLQYEIIGDSLERFNFIEAKKTIVTKLEMALRDIPGVREILFKTGLFALPARLATEYNRFWYYRKYGIKHRERILTEAPQYNSLYFELPGLKS